ncbi:unnamed protein product, partial [Aphanomyces euteiches]
FPKATLKSAWRTRKAVDRVESTGSPRSHITCPSKRNHSTPSRGPSKTTSRSKSTSATTTMALLSTRLNTASSLQSLRILKTSPRRGGFHAATALK